VEKQQKVNKKTKEGIVTSNKMKKTVVVLTERKVRHPLYQKVIRITQKFKAHDEGNVCAIGDRVRIMETRPLSATKRWVVMEVLEKGRDRIEEEDKGMPAPIRRTKAEGADKTKETTSDTN